MFVRKDIALKERADLLEVIGLKHNERISDAVVRDKTDAMLIAQYARECWQTNCKNCAAPLHNQKCEYCRTEYYSDAGDDLVNMRRAHVLNRMPWGYMELPPDMEPSKESIWHSLIQSGASVAAMWLPR